MLIGNKKSANELIRCIHKELKPYNPKLSINKLSEIFYLYFDVSFPTPVFITRYTKEAFINYLESLDINFPDPLVVQRGFLNSISLLHTSKDTLRTEMCKAKVSQLPYELYDNPDLLSRRLIDVKSNYKGFSLKSFAYKNKITLDDACVKIKDLIDKKIIYCIGYSKNGNPYFQFNYLYEYIENNYSGRKFIPNIDKTKFFNVLNDALMECLSEYDLDVIVNKISIVGHIESNNKISGSLSISINTNIDISSLSKNIKFTNLLLDKLSIKVKNAMDSIAYIHFENNFLKPKEFLNNHLSFFPSSNKIITEFSPESYIDDEWNESYSSFIKNNEFRNIFYSSVKLDQNEYIHSKYSEDLNNSNPKHNSVDIDISRYFTNIKPISSESTPAYIIEQLDGDDFCWNPPTLFQRIIDIQMNINSLINITETHINNIGILNWCVNKLNENNKKVSRQRKNSSKYYLYYDLKEIPSKLIAIGCTTAHPIDFFKKSDKFIRSVKGYYSEISVQECSEETIDAVKNIFSSNKHYLKMIRFINDCAILPKSKYSHDEDHFHVFEPKIFKAPLIKKTKPRACFFPVKFTEKTYTKDEIRALNHHISDLSKLTIPEISNNEKDAFLINGILSSKHFNHSENEWSYSYGNESKWAKLKVSKDKLHILIQGEEFYDLNYSTKLEQNNINVVKYWIPVIYTLIDVMNFNFKNSNLSSIKHNQKSLTEINDLDIFNDLLRSNFMHFSENDFGSGFLGQIMSRPHIKKEED